MRQVRFAALGLAGVMGIICPMTALAGSPSFARTQEEWSSLQDNRLEYGEIADLILEYNVTVQNNQYEYNQFIKDYGKSREDVAKEYRELADNLESNISGEDSAGAMVSDLQLQLQADEMRETADDTVEDSYIYALGYRQQEASLALSAQSLFISYYKSQKELQSAKEKKQILENTGAQTASRQQAGMATQSDVLSTQEAVLEQEKNVRSLELEIESTRQKLIVMLGWKASDQPEIGELPSVSLDEINAIDFEADKQTALENNYTLRINKRKLENAVESAKKENLRKTIEGNEKKIGDSMFSARQTLLTAKMTYEQALADEETENRNTLLARQKWNAGMITKYELKEQEYTLAEKQRSKETASMSLLEAYESYRSCVNGLASAE